MTWETTINAFGDDLGIIIPKEILEKMNLSISDKVTIEIIDNTIILRKAAN